MATPTPRRSGSPSRANAEVAADQVLLQIDNRAETAGLAAGEAALAVAVAEASRAETLASRGVDVSKLVVSANAHVITQYHRTLDKVTERFLGKRQIGTTGRGIGPAYADKINRVGIRIQDLFDENILRQKVEGALQQKNHLLVKIYNRRAISVDEVV